MPIPTTEAALKAAGYTFATLGHCRGCLYAIEWWWTPRGKAMPFDPETYAVHWETCPVVRQLRKKEKS